MIEPHENNFPYRRIQNCNIMILITCLLILAFSIFKKDTTPLLERLKNINWRDQVAETRNSIRKYSRIAGRKACEPLLKLWYVLDDPETSTWDKALIYAAIFYTVSPRSIIPAAAYRLLGLLDEGFAVLFVIKKVQNRITPAVESRVKAALDRWFGEEQTVNDVVSVS